MNSFLKTAANLDSGFHINPDIQVKLTSLNPGDRFLFTDDVLSHALDHVYLITNAEKNFTLVFNKEIEEDDPFRYRRRVFYTLLTNGKLYGKLLKVAEETYVVRVIRNVTGS